MIENHLKCNGFGSDSLTSVRPLSFSLLLSCNVRAHFVHCAPELFSSTNQYRFAWPVLRVQKPSVGDISERPPEWHAIGC